MCTVHWEIIERERNSNKELVMRDSFVWLIKQIGHRRGDYQIRIVDNCFRGQAEGLRKKKEN